jgi:hypothetical protein
MRTKLMNVVSIIVVLATYFMLSALIIPIVLVGKDTTFPTYKILMNSFITIESVGSTILVFGIIFFRKMRSNEIHIREG